MKKILLFLSFLLMSIGVLGASYTITFNGTNSESTGISTSTTAASITNSSSYVTGNIAASTKAYGSTSSGIKLGTSSESGSIKINLSASGQVTPTSIVINCKLYNSRKSATLGVNGSIKQSVSSSYGDLTFNITSAITYIQLDVTKYVWVKSITVNYSNTPTPSAYTVTYNLNGGTGTIPTETNKEKDATFDLHNGTTGIIPPSCKTFSKWKDQDNNEFNGGATYTMPAKNVMLTAQWVDVPLYTVSFSSGAEAQTQTTCGGAISLPTPTVSSACSALGWSFAGWCESNSDYSSLKKDTYIPTSNITLYAVYKKSEGESGESAYVIFQAPGGGDSSTERTSDSDIKIEVVDEYGGISTFSGSRLYDGGSGAKIGSSKGIGYITMNLSSPITTNQITVEASQYGSDGGDLHVEVNGYTNFGSDIAPSTGTCVFTNATNMEISSVTITTTSGRAYLQSVTIGEGGSTEYSFNPSCETVDVDTVTLPVDTIRIHVGETYELTPTVLPSNATNKNVLWMSTMPSIATVENGVVTGVAEGLAAAIVVTEDGNKSAACVVIVLGNANIDVVEWNPDWLKIDIENFVAVTATLEDQNTQAEVKENIATKLFFSKYFEAAANIKLWAIYNGTKDTIPLTNVRVLVSSNGNAWDESDAQKVTNLDTLGRIKKGYICPNEEIIVYNDGDKTGSSAVIDTAVMRCVNEKYNISEWYLIKNNTTAFSGDDGLMLLDGTDTLDIIGIMEPDYFTVGKDKHSIGTINNPHGDSYGWCCENGETVNGDSTALSTNRCLLIRKSTVHSGDTAVKYNRTNFITLCSEWVGEVVEKHEGDKPKDAEVTCGNFTYVGSYNYTDHYVGYDTIYTEKPIPGQEDDGYYKIYIPQLDTLACTNLKITVKDASNDVLEEVVKIPIMIKTNTTTDNTDYFDKKDCDKCDVVVLKDKTLTTHGTKANRNMKLYEGAELVVDNSSTYTLNSLSFRRYNDSISSLYMNGGTLNVTDKVYFDLYITPDDWHYIALPTSYTISNVKYVNGNTPVYGEDYLVRHYDGKYRAENLKGGWKNTPLDSTFNAGNGFIFGLSDDHKKKEFRFEFNNSVITDESSNKTVNELHAWGGNKTDGELRPNHKGWNLIGNPFLGHFNAEIFDKIRVDSLVKVIENGKWTGQWELSNTTRGKSLRYAVIPSDAPEDRDAGGYKSVVLDDMKLLPFTCFFVQIGGNDESAKGIEFKASRRSNRIVARNYQEDEDDELFLRVKVDNWKTGCFISNKFSDKYEPGDDLESRYPIYQSIGGYKLLYSAISDSIIEHGVQVTAPQGTLYLDPKVDINKFEYIYVNYNDSWFDLMHRETVNIESGSFILQAKRKNNNVATGLDAIPTNGVYKFSDGNNIYINRNNTIFNIIGSKVK